MISRPLVSYVLTAARRDRLLVVLLAVIAAGAGVGSFLGSAAITEQQSFSIVFGAGALRGLGVIGVILFSCFYMRRAFESKEVEFMLARPLSRTTYLLSHAVAFSALAIALAAVITGVVFLSGAPVLSGLAVWGASLAAEYVIVAVTALFFSIVVSSAAGAAVAVLGFYALARLIGILIGIARHAPENIVFAVLNNVVELVSVFIPRLDVMGQTSWLVYGYAGSGGILLRDDAGWLAQQMASVLGVGGFITAQAVVFVTLLLSAAVYDFSRREF